MKHEIVMASGRTAMNRFDIWSDTDSFKYERLYFCLTKRVIDLVFAIFCLPILLSLTCAIFLINPIWNPGPVFYKQRRMGRNGKIFKMWKFRSMVCNGSDVRDANAPLEAHRIPPIGHLLRTTKLDEQPNILNVLTGDMSLVGPRPDAFEHAIAHALSVPRYRNRFSVRPGITGLAQVRSGYADDLASIRRKAHYDSYYIKSRTILLELTIILATVHVIMSGIGQR